VGYDHKLFIILNKADQFCRIHDFARAYGSLCWNLSKVISRKDLPRIYTMCLPSEYLTDSSSMGESLEQSSEGGLKKEEDSTKIESVDTFPTLQSSSFYKQGILDLEESR
jgi:hypothetical protein